MLGWWAGDGDGRDIASGLDGTLNGGLEFVPAIVDEGFLFDGIDDYVEVPYDPRLNLLTTAITIDAWVEILPPLESVQSIVHRRRLSNNSGFRLAVSGPTENGRLDATVFGEFGHLSNVSIEPGVPTHVAWTYDASLGVSTLYIDGTLDSVLSQSAPISPNDEPLFIGAGEGAITGFGVSHAVIDELEIFDRALTAAEVRAIYEAGSAGKCKDGVADFAVSVSGTCPGEVTIAVTTPEPDEDVILFAGPGEGTSYVPWGPCGGTELDIAFGRHWRTLTTDANGEASITRTAFSGLCGRFLQALDRSCSLSNVAQLP